MSEFANKVILITGAGRGVGRKIAEVFAARGAVVAANDITPINVDVTIEHIVTKGGRAEAYIADISKKMPLQAMINEILDDWGHIDILVNNAVVKPRAPILDMDEWDWQRTVAVNLTGPFLVMQSVGRVMREAGSGVIVNIVRNSPERRGLAAYIASNHGLISLTRSAAREFRADNIRVNAVIQGTPALPDMLVENLSQDSRNILELTLFLCSHEAAHLTGQIIVPGTGNPQHEQSLL